VNRVFRIFNLVTLGVFHNVCLWLYVTTAIGWVALVPTGLFIFLVLAVFLELAGGSEVGEGYENWLLFTPERPNRPSRGTIIGSSVSDLEANLNHYVQTLNWDLGRVVICVPAAFDYEALNAKIKSGKATSEELQTLLLRMRAFVRIDGARYVSDAEFLKQFDLTRALDAQKVKQHE